MSILENLGLNIDEVRDTLGSRKPEASEEVKPKYLQAEGQRRMRKRLSECAGFIYARYLEGYSPKMISNMLCVSEESIRSRLRKKGFFGKKGPGRPKGSSRKLPKRLCISPPSPLTR